MCSYCYYYIKLPEIQVFLILVDAKPVELWTRIHSAKRTNILILIVNISIQNIHDHRINFQCHHLKNFIFCWCWYQRSIFFCGTAAPNVLKTVFSLQRELSQQRLTFNKRHIPTMPSSQEQQPPHNTHLLMTATFSQRFGNLSASKQPIQKPDWRRV